MIDDVLGEFGEVCHRRRPQLMHKIAADDGWSEGTSRRILGQGCVSHSELLRARPGAACHDMRAYSKFKASPTTIMRALGLLWIVASLALVPQTLAVKEKDFKTCSQSGFCRRGRALASRAREADTWNSPYSVDASSISIASDSASVTAGVKSSLYPDVKFQLELRVHDDGVVRVRMDEVDGLRKRYDEAASWALIAEPTVSKTVQWQAGKDYLRAIYGPNKELEVAVSYEPLRVALLRNGKAQAQQRCER